MFKTHCQDLGLVRMSIAHANVKWQYLFCVCWYEKDILVIGEGLTQGLDTTTITAEAKLKQ